LEENPQAIIARLDGMGEPTMHPRIFDLIRISKNAGLSTVLHSNFCTSACDRIDMFFESGLDRLVISIDGATPSTYSRYRVGGDLERVIQRTRRLLKERRKRSLKSPIVEIQMVDLPFNRHERQLVRNLTKGLGADRFQLTEAEQSTKKATYHPTRPRRCPWLWTVLTVGWNLDYHSCTNAWSFGWPRMNMRDVSTNNYWNHPLLKEARSYNLDKSSTIIDSDDDCKCSQCYEMVVVPLTGRYFNE
jgi:MoaA/NifB/PqqE/SkfB family radical SAM enzyme